MPNATVSRHLRVLLHDAKLVRCSRRGNYVLYLPADREPSGAPCSTTVSSDDEAARRVVVMRRARQRPLAPSQAAITADDRRSAVIAHGSPTAQPRICARVSTAATTSPTAWSLLGSPTALTVLVLRALL